MDKINQRVNQTKLFAPLFLNQAFRALALSLPSLFTTVFIYRKILSLSGQENLALLSVFSFFLGIYGFKLLSVFFAEELSLRLGLKRQLYLGLAFSVVCFLTLSFSQQLPSLLLIASPVWGLSVGFYWFGWHGLMIKFGRKGFFGKELGASGAVSALLLAAVPFLGGLLIDLFGYTALFLTSLVFILFSALVARFVKWERTHHDTSPMEVFGLLKTHGRVFFAYAGESASATIYSIVFPIYLFLILQKELAMGEFLTLSMVLVALISLLVGRWVDSRGREVMLGFGSAILFLVWLGRFLTQAVGVLFILDVIDRIADKMVGIPLISWTYEKALDGHSTGRAILFREMAVVSGAVFSCLLLIVMTLLGIELRFVFLASAVLILLPLLVSRGRSTR
jgi:MFS family permease